MYLCGRTGEVGRHVSLPSLFPLEFVGVDAGDAATRLGVGGRLAGSTQSVPLDVGEL